MLCQLVITVYWIEDQATYCIVATIILRRYHTVIIILCPCNDTILDVLNAATFLCPCYSHKNPATLPQLRSSEQNIDNTRTDGDLQSARQNHIKVIHGQINVAMLCPSKTGLCLIGQISPILSRYLRFINILNIEYQNSLIHLDTN